jgi:hypothetical protein
MYKRANVVHCCNGYFQELFIHTRGTHTRHVGGDAMKGSMKKREKSSFLCFYLFAKFDCYSKTDFCY